MRSQSDDLLVEHPVRAEAGLDAHGPRYVRGSGNGLGPGAGEDSEREHSLGPVDEGQTFFVGQPERFEARGAQRIGRGTYFTLDLDRALADERQSEVGEQSEVARRPERPLCGHDGVNRVVQHARDTLGQLESNPRDPHCEGARLEQHHRPHHLGRQGRTDRRGVRSQDGLLEALRLGRVDADAGQVPKSGRDPVDRRARIDGLLDDPACGGHVVDQTGRQIDRLAGGHGDNAIDVERFSDEDGHGATLTRRCSARRVGARRYPSPMDAIRPELLYVDGAFEPGKAVVLDGASVESVIDAADLSADVDDWGHVALLPGTVNAHGHAFQNLFKGFADDRAFESWRDDVLYPFSERLDGDAIYAGALFAFAEALLAGVTTTVDFFYLHDEGNENAEHVIRAAHELGIRLVFARTFYDRDAPTGAPARFRGSPEDAAERTLELAKAHQGDPNVSVQPAPHSLHAATPETIALALDVADRLSVPCHLHLAEAAYERDQVVARYGTTPVRLLEREGLLRANLVTIHTVWVDDEELDMLAEAGTGVVHCPGANAFLGDGVARLPEMLRRGIRVGLGPDGGCANNRQSVFDAVSY